VTNGRFSVVLYAFNTAGSTTLSASRLSGHSKLVAKRRKIEFTENSDFFLASYTEVFEEKIEMSSDKASPFVR
jgi:hypothetical protein